MNVSMRAKAIYELSRAMNITMMEASEILQGMAESIKNQCEVV